MRVYGLVMKHRFAKEWDKDRLGGSEWSTSRQVVESRLATKNEETLAESGELIWEIVEIKVDKA